MFDIFIRPASTVTDDGLRYLRNFDSQLSWLSSIGSSTQWGSSPRGDQEDQRVKYRDIVQSSERGWDDPWSQDMIRAYIAEINIRRDDLSPDILKLTIAGTSDVVRLPVAGMILQGSSSEYVRSVLPKNDDEDPFIYLFYLLSDRTTGSYGKGAGAALISHAKDEARRLGVKRLCVDCWRGNDEKLVHYYERQGFRVLGHFEEKSWPGTVLETRV